MTLATYIALSVWVGYQSVWWVGLIAFIAASVLSTTIGLCIVMFTSRDDSDLGEDEDEYAMRLKKYGEAKIGLIAVALILLALNPPIT